MNKNKVIFTHLLICDADHLILPVDAHYLLSDAEQGRLAQMRHPGQARLFLLGRYLLRQLLAMPLGQAPRQIAIDIDSKGKPRLGAPGWHFNISHSGSLLALAFGNQAPLGIDVENRQLSSRQIERLARRYFTVDEQLWLGLHDNADGFLRLWTTKEAVLKAHGGGIANNLSAVQWQPNSASAQFAGHKYQLHQYGCGQSRLTLAVEGDQAAEVACLSGSDLPPALEITGPQPNLCIKP